MLDIYHWILDYFHPAGYVIDEATPNQSWFLLFKEPVTFLRDDEVWEVPADYGIVYTPGSRRHYYNPKAGYHHDGILSYGNGIAELAEALGIPCNTPFPIKNAKEISALIRELTEETLLPQPHTPEVIDLRIRLLLHKLADAVCTEEEELHRYQQAFFDLRKALFQEPERDWRAEEAAASMHLSISRFLHVYKDIFKSTWKQDLINSRIGHAKYLLRSSSDTSDQIAAACGYKNVEHFFRQFKRHTGQTPGSYRREHRVFLFSTEER